MTRVTVASLVLTGVCSLNGCDSTQTAPKTNIILISVDTLRRDHLGCYGYGRPTSPNIDALAARGMVFENAIAPSPWTLPSHASLLTGLQSHSIGLPGLANKRAKLDRNHVMIPEVLRGAGYRTYMSGKWHLGLTDNFGTIDQDALRDPRVRGFAHLLR